MFMGKLGFSERKELKIMAAAAMAKLCNLYSASPSHRLSNPAKKKLISSPKFILTSSSSSSSSKSSLRGASPPPINATNSPTEDKISSTKTTNEIIPQEDVKYLWKLGIGSVAAAALIKYGSVFFPEITRPNLLFALLIISTPVILSIFVLINKSRSK